MNPNNNSRNMIGKYLPGFLYSYSYVPTIFLGFPMWGLYPESLYARAWLSGDPILRKIKKRDQRNAGRAKRRRICLYLWQPSVCSLTSGAYEDIAARTQPLAQEHRLTYAYTYMIDTCIIDVVQHSNIP